MLSRRQLGLLGASALLAPRRLLAGEVDEHCFLFVYCEGGWDTTRVFTPMFDSPIASMEPDTTLLEVGGIPFVDSNERPSVRRFFSDWSDQTAIISGLEVQSVTHERCQELILTGTSGDDWPSILGAHATAPMLMPHIILDGLGFTNRYTSQVVRIGDNDQLPDLLSGEALSLADTAILHPSAAAESLEDAFVRDRLARLEGSAAVNEAVRAEYARVAQQHSELLGLAGVLDLRTTDLGCERDLVSDANTAFNCFELGISRCAMIRYQGWCSEGWDTHQNLELQSTNFEDLFSYLDGIMSALSDRGALSKRVTVVVFSEMGRAPQLNTWGGKDHWTFTSTMLMGAGIAGGQSLGAVDDYGIGLAIDLDSGALSTSGEALSPAHLGATLLTLGGIDAGEYTGGVPPIGALLS